MEFVILPKNSTSVAIAGSVIPTSAAACLVHGSFEEEQLLLDLFLELRELEC